MLCSLNHIEKSFDDQIVFHNLQLQISSAGLYLIKGISGSGKTTLLNILAGYESFERGERTIAEYVNIACIFQNYELISTLTVEENISLYEILHDTDYQNKSMIVEQLNLQPLLDHYPHECSRGQQQRVAIARALMMDPTIIICDEPTESLDQENKHMVMHMLNEYAKTKVVIIASHEVSLVEPYKPFIYEIMNYQLHETESTSIKNPCVLQKQTIKTNMKNLKRILNKNPKGRMQMICMSAIIISVVLLIQAFMLLFQVTDTKSVLNANAIYVRKNFNVPLSITAEPILEFQKINIKGTRYQMNIVPYKKSDEDFSIVGKTPENFYVMINQNAKRFISKDENVLGKTLEGSFNLNQNTYSLTFTVGGVIEENDAGSNAQLYYDEDALKSWLMSQKSFDGYSLHDLMQNQTNLYVIYETYAALEATYDRLKGIDNISVTNVLLDERYTIANERYIYKIAFTVILILLVITQIYYILYSTFKAWKTQIMILAIIHSCQVKLHEIRYAFFRIKLNSLMLVQSILLVEIILFYSFTHRSFTELIILILYSVFSFMFYLSVLWFCQNQLYKTQIASFLKNSKDQ